MTVLESKALRRSSIFRRLLKSVRHDSFVPIMRYLYTSQMADTEPQHGRATASHHTPLPSARDVLESQIGASGQIPRRIFQTWKSRSVVPENYTAWRSSFSEVNPEFDMFLWDDDDNRSFVAWFFPWFLETYDKYPREIFRADAIRPLFLFLLGGFYADMDTECLRPLETLRDRSDVVLGQMGSDRAFEHSIPNAIMAGRPFQMFWLLYVKTLMDRAARCTPEEMDALGPEVLTGPVALKDVADYYLAHPSEVAAQCSPVIEQLPETWQLLVEQGRLDILPPDAWYGLDWTNPVHRRLRKRIMDSKTILPPDVACRLFPEATMVTYWSHSW